MASYDFEGLVRRFRTLATRSASGEAVEADLAHLVAEVGETAQAAASATWQAEVRRVRGRVRLTLHNLEVSEPALPGKLADPANQAQRAFYTDAIAQLSLLIEDGT